MTHVGPRVARIGIGLVLTPDDAAHAQQVAELLVGTSQQGAYDEVAATGYGREALGSRPPDGVHEEGLRPVVGGVRRQDARRRTRRAELPRELARELGGGGVARLAASVLHVGA